MSNQEQYEYRCYLVAQCKQLMRDDYLNLCNFMQVDEHDVDSIKPYGLTNPQIEAIKCGDTVKLIQEGVLK